MKYLISLKELSLGLLILATVAVIVTPAQAAKLYKWVDAEGRISYQDKPPPSNGKILSETKLKARKKAEEDVDDAETDSDSEELQEDEGFLSKDGLLSKDGPLSGGGLLEKQRRLSEGKPSDEAEEDANEDEKGDDEEPNTHLPNVKRVLKDTGIF